MTTQETVRALREAAKAGKLPLDRTLTAKKIAGVLGQSPNRMRRKIRKEFGSFEKFKKHIGL